MAKICLKCGSTTTEKRPTHYVCDRPTCKRVVLLQAGRRLMDDIHAANAVSKKS